MMTMLRARRLFSMCATVMTLTALTAARADASTISFQFSTTVVFVDPGAAGYPSSLAGLAPGAPITGTLTFDPATSSPVSNSFPAIYGLATLYSLGSASFSVNVNGTIFNTWAGPLSAFVWDNDTIFSGLNDGVVFTNLGGSTTPLFQMGSLALPTSTFGSEALPTNLSLSMVLELGQFGSTFEPWLRSGTFSPTAVTPSAVPEPATLFLLGAGLGIAGLRLRRSTRSSKP